MSNPNMMSLMHVSPKDLPNYLALMFEAGLVPFIRSSPGKGKSALLRQFAEDYNLVLLDIRLSMYESIAFTGPLFKDSGKARYLPTNLFPLETDEVPKGKNGFLILLDEFNHAEPDMIRASYKLILDRMVGEHKIHPQTYIALAGNCIDDNALANSTGTALNSRVTHLILNSSPEYWLDEIAPKFNCDYRIIGFLAANKEKLNDFDPEQEETSHCCERTWEKVARLLELQPDVDSIVPLIAGTITPGVAAEFIQFCKIYENLVTLNEILKDPTECRLPDDSPTRWALTTQLAKSITVDNSEGICTYVNRLPLQYIIIFMSMIKTRTELFSGKAISNLFTRLGKAAHQ